MKEKKCKLETCGNILESKNSKQKFCSLNCKNQDAYLTKKTTYVWEAEMSKARRKNQIILESIRKDQKKIELTALESMGFSAEASYLPLTDYAGLSIFRFGNVGIRLLSHNLVELLNFK